MIITNNYISKDRFCAFIHDTEKDLIKSWPDERGITPRDMSLGYIDLADFGRLHAYPLQLFKNKLKENDQP